MLGSPSKVEGRADGSVRLVSSNLRTHVTLYVVLAIAAMGAVAYSIIALDRPLREALFDTPVLYLFLVVGFPRATVRRVVELDPQARKLRVSLEARSFLKWKTVPLWSAGFDQVMTLDRVSFGPGEPRGLGFDIVVRVEGETRYLATLKGSFLDQRVVENLRSMLSERSSAAPRRPSLELRPVLQ